MVNEPRGRDYHRGVASVPRKRRPALGEDTADLPRVEPLAPTLYDTRRPDRLQVAPRGMVVRRRWRELRSGAGWTWTGVTFLLICWGVWVLSVRGTELLGPVIGLALVLATGLLLFVLARLLGRAVLERWLGRQRHSAWPSHLAVCVFLTMAGITFLQQTLWIRDSWDWVGESWQALADVVPL